MRWVLAGFSFAVLLGLAVGTVAVKAANVAARSRMQELERKLLAQAIERAKRRQEIRAVASRSELERRLRALQRVMFEE